MKEKVLALLENADFMAEIEKMDSTEEVLAAFRANGVEYVVLKNTLVRRALQELNIEGLDEVLNGPSAFAFGMNDPVSPAKIINDFITKNKTEVLSIKAGLLGTEVMSMDQIKSLAETPSREVLLARFIGSLCSVLASSRRPPLTHSGAPLLFLAERLHTFTKHLEPSMGLFSSG